MSSQLHLRFYVGNILVELVCFETHFGLDFNYVLYPQWHLSVSHQMASYAQETDSHKIIHHESLW